MSALSGAESCGAPASRAPGKPKLSLPLIDDLLREQSDLTAVERFAQAHDRGDVAHVTTGARNWRDLIPLTMPQPGQQYAFEVDLDRCTGCKACVAACHTLNGLDEGELWRTVGLLHGGTADAPAQQTVTTACHHCVEPACLTGCPVKAYEKDPITGIVRHLDDQCIGCQYCTMMCPYDVPKYNKQRGIVRKCDMCSQRLAVGEAPACVQACPNEAIRISVVEKADVIKASDAGAFLPGAPDADFTLPTTVYKSAKQLPRNMLPADFYNTSPEHAHPSLVIMLVLTQLAVGTLVANAVVERLFGRPALQSALGWELGQTLSVMALTVLALGAATCHLGRPQYAFRALLGLRTSWMSREALAFGLFAGVGTLYALAWLPERLPIPGLGVLVRHRTGLGAAAATLGILGVFCSAMIYAATRRSQWQSGPTTFKFFGTMALLGAAGALVSAAASSTGTGRATPALVSFIMAATLVKLVVEVSALRHLADRRHSVMKRVARLMIGDL
jgi:Fe-S-cluster-containing dehydrogenase component/DMSO reductase anchor subunit